MLEGQRCGIAGEHFGDRLQNTGDNVGPIHSNETRTAYNPLAWGIHSKKQMGVDQGKYELSTFPPTYC